MPARANTPIITTKQDAFRLGFSEVWPTFFGVISFGLVTGVTTKAVGLPALEAIALSSLMFAGTAQLAALQLLTEGAPFLIIILTAAFVNLRYVMYSAALQPALGGLPFKWRAWLSYLMVDQSFAFAIPRFLAQPEMPFKHWYYLGISTPLWFLWTGSAATGVLVGAQIPGSWGLEFTLPLVFMAILVNTLKTSSTVVAALVAAAIAPLTSGLPYGLGLVTAALSGIAAGMLHKAQYGAPSNAQDSA